jgi:ATP-dependent exoDNAse (exonuclease V) beta subunit
LLVKLKTWYEEELGDYNTATAIQRNLGLLRLMKVFADELAAYRKEKNALLISDTHFLLMKLTQDTSASFIYEKTGQQFQHFLIDEFQDTSVFQWKNFFPLLTESLANGHFNLIVGDVKQAIYRWRNGDWRLLLEEAEKDLHSFSPKPKTLQENHRSARQIIEFNNLLFYAAPDLLQKSLNVLMIESPPAAQMALRERGYFEIFTAAYADAFQVQPASVATNGMVWVRWLTPTDEKRFEQLALEALQRQVNELLAEGFQPGDMAVLVRTNQEARLVVDFLSANQTDGCQYPIVSADALLLSSNRAVAIIVCALQCLLNERNSIALAQLKYLLLVEQGMDASRASVFSPSSNEKILPDGFVQQRQQLSAMPLQELIHQLIILFDLHRSTVHHTYLFALADLVKQYLRAGESTLGAFMQYWEEEGRKMALPGKGTGNALEVLTIHKSKGLAYRIVLMPFLHWELEPKSHKAPTLWVNNRHTPFNEIPVVPVRFSKDLAQSHYSLAYFEEIVLTAMDNLNLAYVAFTRPRQRLYAWAPDNGKEENSSPAASVKMSFPSNVGELLSEVAKCNLPGENQKYADTRQNWNEEEKSWKYGIEQSPTNKAELPNLQNQLAPIYSHWKDRLTIKHGDLTEKPDQDLTLPRNLGTLLHEVLGRMEMPDQIEKVLQRMEHEGWIDERSAQKLRNHLEPLLQLEALKPWHRGGWKRLAERNILTENRELKRPDLVLYNNETCLVYDFKFTQNEDSLPNHERQMKEYLLLIEKMGFTGLQGYLIYGHSPKSIPVNI